ncbi:replication initiator [Streptomyces sp. NPDC056128]|uniref:replication initiator n=1 Tax=Streptomyces sp. NPDC056128 TaxID=3345721 RepID=UPI0035D7466B
MQSRLAQHARLSFARVTEYQRRAAVHLHAVVRLDGPDGVADDPPAWGTADRLTHAVRVSAGRVLVRTPHSPAVGELVLRWGAQIDVRQLRADGDGPEDDAVAAYVAKYVTKGVAETGAGTDHRLTTWADMSAPSCGVADASAGCPRTCPCTCAPGPTRSGTGVTS